MGQHLFKWTSNGVTGVVTSYGYGKLRAQTKVAQVLRDRGINGTDAWKLARIDHPTPTIATFVGNDSTVEWGDGHHVGTLALLDELISAGDHVVGYGEFTVPNSNGKWDIHHVLNRELVEIFGVCAPMIVAQHQLEVVRCETPVSIR